MTEQIESFLDETFNANGTIERFEFADNVVWELDDVVSRLNEQATAF